MNDHQWPQGRINSEQAVQASLAPVTKIPAWQAALPLNRDEEWVDVMDVSQPRTPPNEWVEEDYVTRRVHRLTPVRVDHMTRDGLAVVSFR